MPHRRTAPLLLLAATLPALVLPPAGLGAQEVRARAAVREASAAREAPAAGDTAAVREAPAARAWEAGVQGAVLLGFLLAADGHVRVAAGGVRGEGLEEAAAAGRWLGDWQRSLPWATAGVLGLALATHGDAGWGRALAALGGTFAASMANESINVLVGRDRPLEESGPLDFDPLAGHASFPSGHTAFAFGLAAGVDAITDGWVPSTVAYAAASVTGLSRIYDDKHWLSDVVAGAVVGTLVSRTVTRWAVRRLEGADAAGTEDGSGARRPRVELLAGPAAVGARLRF